MSPSTATTIGVVTQPPPSPMAGRMTSGFPISSIGSSVMRAVAAAQMSGHRACSTGLFVPSPLRRQADETIFLVR